MQSAAHQSNCFHCGLENPPQANFSAKVLGKKRFFCCPGCQAVATTIESAGLATFYKQRTSYSNQPIEDTTDILLQFNQTLTGNEVDASENEPFTLELEGVNCAACGWLIEKHLRQISEISKVHVNVSLQRLTVFGALSSEVRTDVIRSIQKLGYRVLPLQASKKQQSFIKAQKQSLFRLGVAGLGMMQVMMYAVGLYFGMFEGMAREHQAFLQWVSFLVATPVVFYSAAPFFHNAWQQIKHRVLGVDVPVSMAIGGAYIASVLSLIWGRETVYFESVCMFTFFLLLGRHLERKIRHTLLAKQNRLAEALPTVVTRFRDNLTETVSLDLLQVGDEILIKVGETVPIDGLLVSHSAEIDESMLTGEYEAVTRQNGDIIYAGSVNLLQPVRVRLTVEPENTLLTHIERLQQQASLSKPKFAAMADLVARFFVFGQLILTSIVATIWYFLNPSVAFDISLAVLVATCPCAFSLATPVALAVSTEAMAKNGLWVIKSSAIQTLASITDVIFDKTGTLTVGKPDIKAINRESTMSEYEAAKIAAALECYSEHPIARAFKPYQRRDYLAEQVKIHLGEGISGIVNGTKYYFGRFNWLEEILPTERFKAPKNSALVLATERGPIASFELQDTLRNSACEATENMRKAGLNLHMLTGDSGESADKVARKLQITAFKKNVSSEQKQVYLRDLISQQKTTAMIGDGINDAPALAGAHVAIAMADGTDMSKTAADAILVGGDISALHRAIQHAKFTNKIVKQNINWAIFYNLAVLPLAAFGHIAPYWAALGMSLSSLVVVSNALRLRNISTGKTNLKVSPPQVELVS